jgi:uncharacterized membrane protein YeaQ/YmgE (transglycosylase-associated protein family)
MEIISALVVGGIVGALAKLLMPGKDPGGVLITILLGIAGGVAAGFAGRLIGWYRPGLSVPGIIASTLGAMVLLGAYRAYLRGRGVA